LVSPNFVIFQQIIPNCLGFIAAKI